MILNQEQLKGLKDGIEQGFHSQGYVLTEREKWIIDLTVESTLYFIEKATTSGK